jgi:hypothetical protein
MNITLSSDKQNFITNAIDWMYSYMKYYNDTFIEKENYTLEELNRMSNELLTEYYNKRLHLRKIIMSDKELYLAMYKECKDNIITNILFEGISKDLNRNPKSSIQPIIPYNHQIPLLQTFYSEKNTLVVKSRRQGASLMFQEMMKHNVIFGNNIIDFTTHKDLNSLDKKGDTSNTIFGKLRLSLKNSMFVNQDIFKNKTDEYRIEEGRIVNGTNTLIGQVLSPNTSVGFQCSNGFIDEIAVVEDAYPNSSDYILGAVSTSTNRLFLYSTFRGTKGNFYKTFENHDDKYWNFITLDWKNHPLCNFSWYDKACKLMNNSKTMIAQELDFNPIATVEGQVYHYISEANKRDLSDIDVQQIMRGGRKEIWFDGGGGTSATVFIMAYINVDKIFLYDVIKTTTMDEHMVKRKLQEKGFFGAELYGDISGSFQTATIKRDWFSLLRSVGIRCNPISNTGMEWYRSKVNFLFLEQKLFYNKNVTEFKDLENAKYKKFSAEIEKDGASHVADALSYGIRKLYPRNSLSTF